MAKVATVKIFCSSCCDYVPVVIEPMQSDDLNGNIVCPKCGLVITTLTAAESGKYVIVKES